MANESAAPPMPPPGGVSLEPRTVAAARGVSWWEEGWRLFVPNVGLWLLTTVIVFCLQVAASVVTGLLHLLPVLGNVLSTFLLSALTVLLAAGLMIGCRSIDRGNPLTIGHTFAALNQRTQPLLIVALIYTGLFLAVLVVVAVIMVALFGVAILGALMSAADPSRLGAAFGTMVSAVLVALLLFLLLWLPVVMLVWFAPALVMLGGMDPWPAMVYSFRGCLKNFTPLLVYGAIGLGLAIVASIPFLLGWLVLYPVTVATVYASYCDIFEDKETT
jgi:uncharacterized membrane protein